MIASSHALYRELKRLIPNLPARARVIRVEIVMSRDAVLREAAQDSDLKTGATITKRYHLVEMPVDLPVTQTSDN